MTQGQKEYGGALYDLAAEEKCEDEVQQSLLAALDVLDGAPAYEKLLANPALALDTRLGLLDEAFRGGVHPYVLNFLKILCERSALGALRGCAAQYRARLYEARGILPVTAESAVALSEAQKTSLKEKLQKLTGKTVLLETAVDASLLGGVRLRYDGKELDGSAAGRLSALRNALTRV